MKARHLLRATTLSAIIASSLPVNLAYAEVLDNAIGSPVQELQQAIAQGETASNALINAITQMPQHTASFSDYIFGAYPDSVTNIVMDVIKAHPDQAVNIATAAINASPDNIADILEAALGSIDDAEARLALINAVKIQASSPEELAAIEEIEQAEPVAELEEATPPAPPPPPAFIPGSDDKPTGVSPT